LKRNEVTLKKARTVEKKTRRQRKYLKVKNADKDSNNRRTVKTKGENEEQI